MREPEYLQKIYRQDPETGNFIIEILLEKYVYAFNEWDSSYFRRRDLDPDLIHFIQGCSDEIPNHYGIDLLFTVSQQPDAKMEELLAVNIRNYFRYALVSEKRTMKVLFAKIAKYIGVAGLFLVLATAFDPLFPQGILGKAFTEGLYIGGWVFLWEAISLFSFNRSSLKGNIAEYHRLIEAKIYFTNENRPIQEPACDQPNYPDGSAARKKEAISKGHTSSDKEKP